MSVFDKLKAYSRKPAAVILATVMATSTIPTTPIAQAVTAAYAAESTTPQPAKGAEKKSYVDATADFSGMTGTITLTNDAFSTTDFQSGEYTLKKADLEKWLLNNQSSQLKAAVKEAAQKAFSDKVLEIQKDNNDAEINIISPTEDDLNALPAGLKIDKVEVESVEAVPGTDNLVCESAGADAWTIKSKGEVDNGALKVKIKSVSFSGGEVKYQVADSMGFPEDETAEPSEEDTKKQPETKTASVSGKTGEFESTDNAIKVSARDAWNGQADKLAADAAGEVSDLVYKGDAKSVSLFAAAPIAGFKADQEKYTDEDGCFEATVDSNTYQVTVKPLKASKHADAAASFTIKWTYPNGAETGKSTKVTVNPVAKKPIDLSLFSNDKALPYRLANDKRQVKAILADANKIVEEKTDGEVKDFFTGVQIDQEAYEKLKDNGGTATLSFDNVGTLDNYDLQKAPQIQIANVESADKWKESSGIVLTGDSFGGEKELHTVDDSCWFHTDAKAKYADGEIALDEGKLYQLNFEKELTFKHEIQGKKIGTFYTKDSDGVIRKVKNVGYNFDNIEPTLVSMEAVAEGKKHKTDDDGVFAAEKMSVSFVTVDTAPNGMASGVNSVIAKYNEAKSGKSFTEETFKGGNNGKYSFEIKANSRVRSDSVKVTAYDNAGNCLKDAGKKDTDITMKCVDLVSMSDAPQISKSWDTSAASNGKYYNTSRTLTLTVKAPFFEEYTQTYLKDTALATITRDGAAFQTVTPKDFHKVGDDTWVCPVTFTEDGDYVVSDITVQDIIGRSQTIPGDTFTIDKTAPKLNVSWNTEAAQNGKYYNAARTATITVEEHNFDPNLFKIEAPVSAGNGDEATPAQIGGWTSNGDTHTATVTFPGQGVYTLSVSGEDLASNKSESYTSPEFVIDTIKPKIDIQNVVNRTAYAGEVAPSAAVHDTNLADGTTIEVSKISYPLSKDDPNPYAGAAINTSATDKSVSYLNPAKTKGNDGVYTLTVQAIDLAGNTESEAVTWSVNRFGSTYVISDNTGKMLDQYLKSSKTTDVKVTEINPSGLDDNKTSVELTRDTKNTTLKSGDNYTTDSDTSSGWSEYNYTVSKSNYDKDGAYRVLFHSEDAAGNSSENTMEGKNAKKTGAAAEINFAVDDTAPIASFVDLASNGKYEESSHKAKVSFEDNLKLSKAQIKVNGKTVATFTADQLEKSPIREFTLDGSSSKQDVTVVAWDAAGNKSKELKATGVLVTNDSFVLWMNNLPLMIGTIVAIVVVAGGIYLVVAKKRKENEEN